MRRKKSGSKHVYRSMFCSVPGPRFMPEVVRIPMCEDCRLVGCFGRLCVCEIHRCKTLLGSRCTRGTDKEQVLPPQSDPHGRVIHQEPTFRVLAGVSSPLKYSGDNAEGRSPVIHPNLVRSAQYAGKPLINISPDVHRRKEDNGYRAHSFFTVQDSFQISAKTPDFAGFQHSRLTHENTTSTGLWLTGQIKVSGQGPPLVSTRSGWLLF